MIDNTTKSHIMQLQAAAKQNRLVVFVGAGVSASAIRSIALQFCNEAPWYTPFKERVLKLMNKENQ